MLRQFQQQIINWKYLQKFNWEYWENIFANTVESISTAAAIQYISPLCASATNKYGDKYVDSLASITNHLFSALSQFIFSTLWVLLPIDDTNSWAHAGDIIVSYWPSSLSNAPSPNWRELRQSETDIRDIHKRGDQNQTTLKWKSILNSPFFQGLRYNVGAHSFWK